MKFHVKFPFITDLHSLKVAAAGTEIEGDDLKPEILASMIKSGHLVSTTDKKAQKVPTVQKLDLESQIPQANKATQKQTTEPISGIKTAEVKIPGIKDDIQDTTSAVPQGQARRGRPSRN